MLAELGAATVLLTLPLAESSGLAAVGDRVCTVEDSGGPSAVACFDRSGAPAGSVAVDAANVDWEDLAVADGAFWIADVGDNRARRESVAVHRVPVGGGPTTTYRLSYADGPRDAEGLVVAGGRAWVVSKELLGAGLYRAPLEDGAVLERVADVPVLLATGAALSPDGTVLAVRDYRGVSEWAVRDGDLVAALQGEPVRSDLPDVEQGEAVAYDGGPGAVLTSTEGEDGPVHRLTRVAAAPQLPAAPEQPAAEQDSPVVPLAALAAGLAAVAALVGARRRR